MLQNGSKKKKILTIPLFKFTIKINIKCNGSFFIPFHNSRQCNCILMIYHFLYVSDNH